jgi:hypothetical protein
VDWIVAKGGMALLATHPDYKSFNEHDKRFDEYPVRYYRELLEYIKHKYAGEYWNALPKDMASFWKENMSNNKSLDKSIIKKV